MKCTFFGHRNTPKYIQPKLEEILIELIDKQNADIFYVGNHGSFDYMVKETLKKLKQKYEHINYMVVLAYIPTNKTEDNYIDYSDSIYPDGLEKIPLKYAIVKRNKWMIEQSETVITYVESSFGGAAQFKELAEKKGKNVINIASLNEKTT